MAIAGGGADLTALKRAHKKQKKVKDYGIVAKKRGISKDGNQLYEGRTSVMQRAFDAEQADLDAISKKEISLIDAGTPFSGNKVGQRVNAERALALRRTGRGSRGSVAKTVGRSSTIG